MIGIPILVSLCMTSDPLKSPLKMQYESLRAVFLQSRLMEITDMPPESICEWNVKIQGRVCNVVCLDEVLVEFKVIMLPQIGQIDIGFFPQSIENLVITYGAQKEEINTRLYPRQARRINFHVNQITGTPDLSTLPPKLTHLCLMDNRISGPIELARLPDSMTQLYLGSNQIAQKVVWYSNLPKSLKQVSMFANEIGSVCAVPGTPKANRDMFHVAPGTLIDPVYMKQKKKR